MKWSALKRAAFEKKNGGRWPPPLPLADCKTAARFQKSRELFHVLFVLPCASASAAKVRVPSVGQAAIMEREDAQLFRREALPLALAGIFEGKMMGAKVCRKGCRRKAQSARFALG